MTSTRRLSTLLLAALAATAMLLPTVASAQTTLTPRTQTIFFGAGCPPANPAGSCESTEYFLSRSPGTSNIGNLATAVAYANRATGGGYTVDEYPADSSLNDSYLLQGGEVLEGQIVVDGYLPGVDYAVDSGVEVTITAHVDGTPTFQRITLVSAEIVKPVVTPGDTTYEFSVELPAELDGVRVDRLRATVGHNSLTVLGNGFVNGTGESFFSLPYYVESTS